MKGGIDMVETVWVVYLTVLGYFDKIELTCHNGDWMADFRDRKEVADVTAICQEDFAEHKAGLIVAALNDKRLMIEPTLAQIAAEDDKT